MKQKFTGRKITKSGWRGQKESKDEYSETNAISVSSPWHCLNSESGFGSTLTKHQHTKIYQTILILYVKSIH